MSPPAVVISRLLQFSGFAYLFFKKTKDIPAFQKMCSKVGLTAPPADGTSLPFISNLANTNNTNTTFSQTNIAHTFINDPEKVEKAVSFLEILVSTAPAIGAYAALLSCTIQFIHGQNAISELRKMNGHLGRSADAAWGRFSFGDDFPQHVHEFVRNEMKSWSCVKQPKQASQGIS